MDIFDQLLQLSTQLDNFIWGPGMIALLLGTGIYLTIMTGGIQFTQLWRALKLVLSKESRENKGDGDISPLAVI